MTNSALTLPERFVAYVVQDWGGNFERRRLALQDTLTAAGFDIQVCGMAKDGSFLFADESDDAMHAAADWLNRLIASLPGDMFEHYDAKVRLVAEAIAAAE